MNVVATVLQIVTPVFVLAGIGFIWVRAGFEFRVEFVTRLAMTLAIPCLIFESLVRTEIRTEDLAATMWACCVGYGLLTVAFFALVRLAGLDIRTYLSPLTFGNTGNLGLPLAYFAFGQEGLDYAIVSFAFMTVYSFTFGVWIVAGGGSILKLFYEPMVPAALLGAAFVILDWDAPQLVLNTLELIGQMAIPLMLITLGVALARLKLSRLRLTLSLSVVRVIICIAVAVLAGSLFGLTRVPLAVLVLQLSTPVAVTAYFVAEKYGANADEVAGFVIVSTVLSVVTIPLTLAFLVVL